MAAFLLAWLVCGALSLADRGIGAPAALVRRASSRPAALLFGLTMVLASTNLIAGVAGQWVARWMTGSSSLLLLAFALLCAAIACLLGRDRRDPVAPWVGLTELALTRPLAAGGFVVFALSAWSGDLLAVAGATVGELAVLGLATAGDVALPDRPAWRWSLAGLLTAVALPLGAIALRG